MRRVERPDQEPEALRRFREANPRGTWKEKKGSGEAHFKADPDNVAVFDALVQRQGRLCAYCEIDISRPLWGQVEHFVPEHLSSEAHNYALDFANMIACCEGGVRLDIPIPPPVDPRDDPDPRAVKPIPETQHCGQVKGGLDPRGRIFDPRELVHAPCLWSYGSDGSMSARAEACAAAALPADLAQNTITLLGLDRKGLRRMRASLLKKLDEELDRCSEEEPETSDYAALLRVAREQLAPKGDRLPAFWSCIRDWAGEAAEEVLGHLTPRSPMADAP